METEKLFLSLQSTIYRKNMDTQLVRLDKPYHIICGSNCRFALHIATLIVVKEKIEGVAEGAPIRDTLAVSSYPVVGGSYDIDGQVWMDTELKDCLVICRENESVSLYTLRKVMEYCGKRGKISYPERILSFFTMALLEHDVKLFLPTDNNNKTIADYEVCLEFETGEHGISCMVYSSNESAFYFYEYFANDDADRTSVGLINRPTAIMRMANLREHYLQILGHDGLRSITFTTKDKSFKDFVDELNGYKADE